MVQPTCRYRGLWHLLKGVEVQGPVTQLLLQVTCCGSAEALHGQRDVLLSDEQSFDHTFSSIQQVSEWNLGVCEGRTLT